VNAATQDRPKAYLSIQQLRAVAALGVVIFHIDTQLARMGYEGWWPNFLSSGVDIFFVISGFIMWITTWDRPTTPIRFMWNRITRIVPLYWIMTAFALAVLLVNADLMQSGTLDWGHVVKSFLFIPDVHPVKLNSMEPLIFAGWTLNYEMMFYLIFAATLFLPARFRLPAAILALLALAGVRLFDPAPLTVLWFYSSEIILEFGMGMLIGAFVTSGRKVAALPAFLMVCGGALALAIVGEWHEEMSRTIVRGIPSALIVLGAVSLELHGRVLKSRAFAYLGDASYSIYLAHGVALSALAQIWRRVLDEANPASWASFTVVSLVVCTVSGAVTYELIERPIAKIIKGGRKRVSERPAVRQPT